MAGAETDNLTLFAKIVCGAGVLLFMVTLVAIANLHGAQSERYQQRADAYSKGTYRTPSQACLQFDGERFLQCVREDVKAHYDNQRAEENLRAQQDMANWTFATLALGLGALLVSGGGLFALVRTVRQGQDQLEHAREVADMETRPIIVPLDVETREIAGATWFRFTWQNVGKHPASILSGKTWKRDGMEENIRAWAESADARSPNWTDTVQKTVLADKPYESAWVQAGNFEDTVMLVHIHCRLLYKTAVFPRDDPWISETYGTLIFVLGDDGTRRITFERDPRGVKLT